MLATDTPRQHTNGLGISGGFGPTIPAGKFKDVLSFVKPCFNFFRAMIFTPPFGSL
jgi:hypothetical protein